MGWLATLQPRRPIVPRARPMTSSPCPFHRVLIISQSDRRSESTHPLAGLHLRANDFCSAICVRACVRVCPDCRRRGQEGHNGATPSRLPPPLSSSLSSCYARFFVFPCVPYLRPFLPFYFGALEHSPSLLPCCSRSLFAPSVSLQILFT